MIRLRKFKVNQKQTNQDKNVIFINYQEILILLSPI